VRVPTLFRCLPPIPTGVALVFVALLLLVPILPVGPFATLTLILGLIGLFFTLSYIYRRLRWKEAGASGASLFALLLFVSVILLIVSVPVGMLDPQQGFPFRFIVAALGMYFLVFSLVAIQPVLGCLARLLMVFGSGLLLGGLILTLLSWEEYRLQDGVEEEPQEMTLQELLDKGPGANRHIRLTQFRYCDDAVLEREGGRRPDSETRLDYYWVPVVPGTSALPQDVPPVPRNIRVVVEERRRILVDPLKASDQTRADNSKFLIEQRRDRESHGYRGILQPSHLPLRPETKAKLQQLGLETNPDIAFVLTEDKPLRTVYPWMIFSAGVVMLLAVVSLGLVFYWARIEAAKLVAEAVPA